MQTHINYSDPLLWAEGTPLTPQHFQYWDQYHAWQRNAQLTNDLQWGFKRIDIDLSALQQGYFKLTHFELRFKHSVYYLMRANSLHYNLERQQFPLTLMLCLNKTTQVNGIEGYPNDFKQPDATAEFVAVQDLYDSKRERSIQVIQHDWQLYAVENVPPGAHALPVAMIRDKDGHYELCKQFIPPITNGLILTTLQEQVQSLLWLLVTSIKIISQQSATMNKRPAWLCYDLQRTQIELRLLTQYAYHPFELYRLWARLNAQLETKEVFYQHDNLTQTFSQLMIHTQKGLKNFCNQQQKTLSYCAQGWWQSDLINETWWRQPLCLIVQFQINKPIDEQWMAHLKVTTPDDCPRMMASALSGIALERISTARLPLSLATQAYAFQLHPTPEQQQALEMAKCLAVVMPTSLTGIQLFLTDLKESL